MLPGGLNIMPLTVLHGEDYECMGFLFGENERVAYLSDVSRIPPITDAILRGFHPENESITSSTNDNWQIDLLIVDCLFLTREHPTHFNFPQALECIRSLKPKRALLVGMSHDFDYDTINEKLKAERDTLCDGVEVMMARDGLTVDVQL